MLPCLISHASRPSRHAARRAFTSTVYRVKLRCLLLGLGVWSWSSSLVGRTWETLVSVVEEALFA